MKEEIQNFTIIAGDFQHSFFTNSEKYSENQQGYKNLNFVNQLDIIEIYKTLYPTIVQYTFFTNKHGTFTKMDHMLNQKINFKKLKRIEIPQ